MNAHSRRNILILSFTLIVVMLGFGMVIPIFPFFIEELGAGGRELGLLVAAGALLEFVCAPIWGSVSDRTGRKPILMVGVLGYGISSLLFGLSTQVWMLFASRILSGILSSAASAASMAYISDSTSQDDRSSGIGILGAAMGLGTIIGPGIGGWLGADSLSLPFFVSAGLSLVALALIGLLLPESLPIEARQSAGKARGVQIRVLWQALFSPIGILLFLLFLASFGLMSFESVFGLYSAARFGYGPERVGGILMVIGAVSAIGKATLVGPLTRRWGEVPIIKLSLLGSTIGFGVLLLANNYPTILLVTGLFILSKTFLRTVLLSLASQRSTTGQGVTMGLGTAFISLGRIVGPIWAGLLFDINLNYPYLSGAATMFIGFLISLILVSQTRETRDPEPSIVPG
jgi:DHA1 family multidrug resistance protein-like MFS transporter